MRDAPINKFENLQKQDEFPHSAAREAVVAVVRAYGMLQRLMLPHFGQFGLTPPQFQLLTIVNRLRPKRPTQRRLAEELYVSFPNITMMLDRLEKSGLIRRRANADDRREKFVELTAAGRSLLRRIWKVHQQQLDRVVAGLNLRQQVELARLLKLMIEEHATATPTTTIDVDS